MIRNKLKMSTLITFIQCSIGRPSQKIRQERKSIQIGNKELSIFADDMVSYIENSDSIKKLLQPINKFNKTNRYKINTQKIFILLIK